MNAQIPQFTTNNLWFTLGFESQFLELHNEKSTS